MFTTSIGMAGPPLLLYFASTHRNKETIRAVSLAYYIFIYLISLLSQVIFEGTSKMVWIYSMYALPIVFLGLIFGQMLFTRLNQKLFKILIYFLLVAELNFVDPKFMDNVINNKEVWKDNTSSHTSLLLTHNIVASVDVDRLTSHTT